MPNGLPSLVVKALDWIIFFPDRVVVVFCLPTVAGQFGSHAYRQLKETRELHSRTYIRDLLDQKSWEIAHVVLKLFSTLHQPFHTNLSWGLNKMVIDCWNSGDERGTSLDMKWINDSTATRPALPAVLQPPSTWTEKRLRQHSRTRRITQLPLVSYQPRDIHPHQTTRLHCANKTLDPTRIPQPLIQF